MAASSVAIRPESFPWFDYSRYTFSLGLTSPAGLFLSGHSASEHDPGSGHMVVKGGMAEQARTAYAKIGALLEAAGAGFGDVTHVVENIVADGVDRYEEAAGVRAEVLGGHEPAVSTVIVRRLLRPQALIEVEVTAGAGASGTAGGEATGGAAGAGGASAAGGAARVGGTVHLPTLLPLDGSGDVVAPGDLVGQTVSLFEAAAAMLNPLGLGLANVVKTLDFSTPETRGDYRRTGRVRRDFLGPVYPAAAGILMPRLLVEGALIALEVTASRAAPAAVNPGWDRYEKLTYSPAVSAGGILFCSGQAALDPETEAAVHPGDVVAQAEYTYTNILKVLAAAGAGPENLVRTVEYVTPDALAAYPKVAGVREGLLARPFPASTGLVCEALLRPEFMIEVDPTAVLA